MSWTSWLYSDYEVIYTKLVNAPVERVVEFLHDPPSFMRLSPVIVDVSVDPNDPTKYRIVDILQMPFGWRSKITYVAKIQMHDDGFEAESAAGAGTRTVTRLKAREVSPGVTELEEKTKVNSFFFFLPFIKNVIADAHNKSNDRLKAKLEELMEKAESL